MADKTQAGNRESNNSYKGSISSHQSNHGGFPSNHFGGKSGPSLESPFNGVLVDPSTDSRVEMNLEAKDLYSQSKFKRNLTLISEEIVKKKNIQISQFSYLDIIQHMGIKSSATEHKFTELDVIQIQANPNQDNMSDQGDDAEEKSEASLEDLHIPDGQQTSTNKKTKVLFASLSPSGMQLAIACEDNTVALMTVMTSSSEHQQSKFLFWPKYKKLSRNSGNAKIVHLSWSLVEQV